jgi:putative nucleotidyltransferase with HDIG domain
MKGPQNHRQSNKFKALSAGRVARAWESFGRVDEHVHAIDFAACVIIAFIVLLMIRQDAGAPSLPVYKTGAIASRTVRAYRSMDVIDADATETEQQNILKRIDPVYDFDAAAVNGWAESWREAVQKARTQWKQRSGADRARRAQAFSGWLSVPVSVEELKSLDELNYSVDLERSFRFAMGPLWDQKIIESRNVAAPGIEIVDIKSSASSSVNASDLDSLLTVSEARSLVQRAAKTESRSRADHYRLPWASWSKPVRESVFKLQSKLVNANVTLNRKETEERKVSALKNFRPLTVKLTKGEVIVREGERVPAHAAQILAELKRSGASKTGTSRLPLEALFGAFSLWLLVVFLRRQFPRLLAKNKDALVAGVGLIVALAAFKLALIFQINVVAEYFGNIPPGFFLFLIPVAAPAMMLRLLCGPQLAIVFSLPYGLGIALMLDHAESYGIHAVLACIVGVHFLAHCRTRTSVYNAGLKTALVSAFSALALMGAWGGELPLSADVFSPENTGYYHLLPLMLWTLAGGFVGGWLSSALTLVVTPILENLLDYTTELKLLELARMDHPLLRDLVLKAPGTYHHSIIVGSLAEAASEAVGANSLLARVGSYYHDVGKLGRPEYFVENQGQAPNPHEHTKPHMSAKIIISHVKEGVLLAQQHKLGQALIDFIEQHHATTLVGFFYHKAKQEAAKPDSGLRPSDVKEEDFRYPGPKPQSKEAAIVALADSCEAATRSLIDPTPARIEGMVKKIIAKAFVEGVLDEADITLREVELAGASFVRILLGIHHNRIQYPDQEQGLPSNRETLSLVKSSGQR